jgi:colanic acid biosynthesis glycosyl transferase WcaI
MRSKRTPGKIVIVSQHYAPDQSTTAGIVTAIATHLAKAMEVLVLSGTSGSPPHQLRSADQPIVTEIKNPMPEKTALGKRALFEMIFATRTGAVAELVGNEGGVVSGVFNLESSGVEASDWRPRHDEHYHEA